MQLNYDMWARRLLIVLSIGSGTLAAVHALASLGLWIKPPDPAQVDIALKYGAFAGISALLLRVGQLVKAKFGGSELEFANVSDQTNSLRSDIEKLKLEVAELVRSKPTSALTETGRPVPGKPCLGAITHPEDKQKGRFGGKSQRDGYQISATFNNASYDSAVISVTIIVTSLSTLPGPVHFYLHSSFEPHDEVIVGPHENQAKLDLLIVGGFTVGAWVEGTDVLLELDLALLKNAPRVVKEL